MIKVCPPIEPLEHRIAPAFSGLFDLASLDPDTGYRLNGGAVTENAGGWISSGADVNGDGIEDLFIAGIDGRASGSLTGVAYVVFGSETRNTQFDLATVNGTNGFKINGVAGGDRLEFINSAGDVNGDGIDDIVLGAWGARAGGAYSGAAYVIFGKQGSFGSQVSLSQLNGVNGFKISGEAENDTLGKSSSAGDINGDGYDDLVLGARGAAPNGRSSGASYVVFGKAGGFAPNLPLGTLDGTNGFKMEGAVQGDALGQSVSGAGDVNGDGFDDFIVGAGGADPEGRYDGGAAYVVFGKAGGFGARLNLATLDGSNGFKFVGIDDGARIGSAVGSADVNGDGLTDLLIGAPVNDYFGLRPTGSVFVVFGSAEGFSSVVRSSALNGTNGFALHGQNYMDFTGVSVSGGDMNGDGFDDILIGAPDADVRGSNSGVSYLVYGKAAGFAPFLEMGKLDGVDGFQILGVAERDRAGGAVSLAGDVNGDGVNDLLIGADYASVNGRTESGAGYVIFGQLGLVVSIGNASATEGSALQFTVSLSKVSDQPVTVQVRTAQGSAAAEEDFTSFLETVTFAPGETTKTVTVHSLSDALHEADETFTVLLSEAEGAPILRGTGVGTILNDDSAPLVSINDPVILEGDTGTGAVVFTVSLSAPSGLATTVQWATANGTAAAGLDYTAAALDTLTFAPGETSKTIGIQVSGETLYEADETFSVVLANPGGAVLGKASGIATIQNDDLPPTLSVADGSLREGDAGSGSLVFTVELSAPSGVPVTVAYRTEDGTALAGSDYESIAPALLTFAPGETTKTVAVAILGDLTVEAHETFTLVLSDASGASIQTGSAAGTILNDDAVLTIGSRGVREGDDGTTPLTYTVSIEQPSVIPITFTYATFDGTAIGGADFVPIAPTQMTIAPGETSAAVTILINGDSQIEAHETFSVVLSEAVGASIGIGTGVGSILNDDTAVWISDAPGVIEGGDGRKFATFEVTLEMPSTLSVSFRYGTVDGTAAAGSDYVRLVGSLTFQPGETSRTIAVEILGDTIVETHESFSVVIFPTNDLPVARGTAFGTILNDDTLVRIDDGSVLEGHDGSRSITFNVSLSAESALPVSVSYASGDGTAIAGLDYLALVPGTLDFAPGEATRTIIVEVMGDVETEVSETFSVLLSEVVNAGFEDATAEGTILNDDVAIAGKRKATYTDVDGDLVTIRVNKGVLKVEDFTLFPAGLGSQLALVDFSGESEFTGANLSITAKRAPDAAKGPRAVDVGYIDASGVDLGKVTIKGDLGGLKVGTGLGNKAGLPRLSAASLGLHGVSTQLPGGTLVSEVAGALRQVKISGDVVDATLAVSGDLASLKIQGALLGGRILSDGRIGEVQISGDLAGSPERAALITASGSLAPESTADAVALGKISIGGSVAHAQILAGYDRAGAAVNADAGIKSIKVAGDWTASDLVAGTATGADGVFGTADDVLLPDGTPVIARIAYIQIKGAANGLSSGGDHYGFVAEQVAVLKIAGMKAPLLTGPSNDLAGLSIGNTGNFRVREVGEVGIER